MQFSTLVPVRYGSYSNKDAMYNTPVLYNDDGTLTAEGQSVDQEITDLLIPIFTHAVDAHYEVRQLSHLIIHSTVSVELMFTLTKKEKN